MKRSVCMMIFATLFFMVSVAWAGGEPNIVGTWKGTSVGHTAEKGFLQTEAVIVVEEQKGPAFRGTKSWMSNFTGKEMSEAFSGTVNKDGSIHTAEHYDGIGDGHVEGDVMTLQYAEPGPKGKAFYYELKRQ